MSSNGATQERSPVLQAYALLTGDEDARACREIPDAACREQPTSFFVHLVSSLGTKAGDELASAKLTIAWLLAAVGAPAFLTGFLVPIRESGALIPQLLVAGFMRRAPVRKWFWVGGSLVQGLSLIGMVVAAATLTGAPAGWTVIGLLAVFSLARGVCSVAHKDVLGKTIDKARRGTAMGYAAAAAGIVTIAAGLYLSGLRGGDADPAVFMLLLGGAGALWILAALTFSMLPEQPGATEGGANALSAALEGLSTIKDDANFRHFVYTRALLLSTAFSLPFYVMLAAERAGVTAGGLGMMLVATGIAGAMSGPIWGRLSDRSSRKVMIAAACIVGVLGIAVFALDAVDDSVLTQQWMFALLFFVLAVAHGGVRLGRKTYLVDFANSDNRAAYTAVSNTLIGLLLLAGGVFGIVAQAFGTVAVILLLAVIALAAAASARALPETGD